ncbi:hypothetical protein Pfo_020454 [Paulownia fortunei]|nr:hypothetical protein Pfo_020454 [Paulownia fortunei]
MISRRLIFFQYIPELKHYALPVYSRIEPLCPWCPYSSFWTKPEHKDKIEDGNRVLIQKFLSQLTQQLEVLHKAIASSTILHSFISTKTEATEELRGWVEKRASMMEFEINLSELPLGNLSKSNIPKGLEPFNTVAYAPIVKGRPIVDASNIVFIVIPSIHPLVIKDEDDFKSKLCSILYFFIWHFLESTFIITNYVTYERPLYI